MTSASSGTVTGIVTHAVPVYAPAVTKHETNIGTTIYVISGASASMGLGYAPSIPIPPLNPNIGVWFTVAVQTPSTPAPFGSGTWEFAQIISLGTNLIQSGASYTREVQTATDPPAHIKFPLLDNSYPYAIGGPTTADGTNNSTSDSPSIADLMSPISSDKISNDFTMYVMFTPPAPTGTVSVPVPLGVFDWSWTGSLVWESGAWTSGTTANPMPIWTATSNAPTWSWNVTAARYYLNGN